ncbi:hypothetical protein [Diplocloster modestus]|uniref:Uncharacterized protein n=1 Tax=Diplocloster modestus TaxID=2850322 RepID=A0ABS6KAC6_9FIRM|nr:hypothetical protein [Diplocloster modestus]MBU9727440.1 hypothetical protein [Diplocloster modestus]
MQAIMETLFDIVYLTTVITLGILMIRRAGSNTQTKLFGIMAVVLGCGDAFHLIPRAYALCTDGLAAHAAALGIGKLVTSITMTIFYVLLYHVWRKRYEITERGALTTAIYILAALRVVLCLFPQNAWLEAAPPLSWGIWRNIPFALIGLIIIVLFYQESRRHLDKDFRFMWLAITISFLMYIPVVLFADTIPPVGALMIPKTIAYVWVVWMGFQASRSQK